MADKTQNGLTQKSCKSWSGESYRMDLGKDDKSYGTPVEGSKTDIRGKKAGAHISNEISELLWYIHRFGSPYPGCIAAISFGALFQLYTRVSSKVVGILLRARRHGMVHFDGEMLFQGRDDDVRIMLLELPKF